MSSSKSAILLFLVFALTLAACQPQPTPAPTLAPTLTLSIWKIVIPAELDWMRKTVDACQPHGENIDLIVTRSEIGALSGSHDFIFHLGTPDGNQSAVELNLMDELLVIVNPDNAMETVTVSELQAIVNGKQTHWPSSEKIAIYGYTQGTRLQELVEDTLGAAWSDNLKYQIMPGLDELAMAVSLDKNGFGLVTRHTLTDKVKILTLEPDLKAAFTLPVYLVSPADLTERQQQFVACVRSATEDK